MHVRMTWPMYRRRQVAVGPVTIQLTAIETEIVSVLLVRRGEHLSRDTIVEAIYPERDAEPDWSVFTLRVFILRIRRKGVPIETRYRAGYSIPIRAIQQLAAA